MSTHSALETSVWRSNSPEETMAAGAELGALLRPGIVVGLTGDFGAGKTCFTKGIARGAGAIDPCDVTSPSFVLLNRYDGRYRIFHFDCYRLRNTVEFIDAGFYDCVKEGIVVVEWADALAEDIRSGFMDVRFEIVGERERTIAMTCHEDAHAVVARDLRKRSSVNNFHVKSVCKGKDV